MIKADVITQKFMDLILFEGGDLNAIASEVTFPQKSNSKSLVFISSIEDFKKVLELGFSILICDEKLFNTPDVQSQVPYGKEKNIPLAFFKTKNIPLAMALLLPLFDGKLNRFNQSEKIHPMSYVHPSAHLGLHVIVGPFCFVGEGAQVGDHTTLGANVVIESFATIGKNSLLHPQVFIGSHCSVGDFCEIHPHTTVGSDGYGYAKDSSGAILKIPQLGRVVIEDHVEIGSGCAIDRATLSETRVGRGTKIDNLCHIAHNCEIGENCLITAGFFVAGSSKIGSRFKTGGNSVVTDHVEITADVTLAGRSSVTHDITEAGVYGGHPLQKLNDYLKTLVEITHIGRLKKDVSTVKKHLNIN